MKIERIIKKCNQKIKDFKEGITYLEERDKED